MPSSVIREYRYDPAERRLYSYHGVPPDVGLAMAVAISKGEYFNRHIRDRYHFTRSRRRFELLSGEAG